MLREGEDPCLKLLKVRFAGRNGPSLKVREMTALAIFLQNSRLRVLLFVGLPLGRIGLRFPKYPATLSPIGF